MVPKLTIHKQKREFFHSCFCIIMSFLTYSDLFQNDAEMLEEQRCEIQQQHEEQQQSLLRLQEAAEAYHAEHMVQEARRKAEVKAKEEAKRQRVAEEKERKRRTVEYLQRLQDKVLEEEATLLEGVEESQVVRSKHKEVAARDKEGQQPSKKARRKYRRGTVVKMKGSNSCERCMCTRQSCLVYPSR